MIAILTGRKIKIIIKAKIGWKINNNLLLIIIRNLYELAG